MLAWPVRVENGRLVTITYGGADEQVQHVGVLLLTQPGERVAVPDYGTPESVGERDYDEQAVLAAADRWCKKAEIVSLDAALSAQETRQLDVTLSVRRR
jgi:hypothetical protein